MALPDTPTDTLDQATGAGVSEATTSTTTGEPTMINAFHPDYVKTYMPEFLSKIQKEEAMTEKGKHYASQSTAFRKDKLQPTRFIVYSKAGTANVKPKGKTK